MSGENIKSEMGKYVTKTDSGIAWELCIGSILRTLIKLLRMKLQSVSKTIIC